MNSIKVAGIDYEVVRKDLTTRLDHINGTAWGLCDFNKDVIEISNAISEKRQNQTLIHEMTHAMFQEAGLDLEDEEDITNRLSMILYQVLKDNDFSWLRK